MAAVVSQVSAEAQASPARNPVPEEPVEPGRTRPPVRRRTPRGGSASRHLAVVPCGSTVVGSGTGRVDSAGGPDGVGDPADEAVRVVVVDGHPVFRLGLAALLDSLSGLGVVGVTGDVAELPALVDRYRPDVVVIDPHLDGGAGVAAVRDLASRHPGTGVLVVTMLDDDESVVALLRAGARGYLLKRAAPAELERAVRAVANGEVLLGPGIAGRAVGRLTGVRTSGSSPLPELTGREREVLDLVAQGLTNVLVARRLGLSPKTVRNHLSTVLHKLQVSDRSEAVRRARQAGLGQLSGTRGAGTAATGQGTSGLRW
ncbi:response regulator transcription factor [Micromonospora echinospora]|uniref:response regulator transcription factor n=1 Tax=Micromonospora echinospora TaxID=1877 RepID=UPI0033DA3994